MGNKSEQDNCKVLFDLVESIGEILDGDLHIICQTADYPEAEGEGSYRVYHKSGYCFDTIKRVEQENEETGDVEEWQYDFFAEWPGFDKIDEIKAIELIKNEYKK